MTSSKKPGQLDTVTSIWYVPINQKLERLLLNGLPWKGEGHKTPELTGFCETFGDLSVRLPEDTAIVPSSEIYLVETCRMLDKSMAHTLDNPDQGYFVPRQDSLLPEWKTKTKTGECNVMLRGNEVVGFCELKGAETSIMAVSPEHQGKGL